MAPLLVSLGMFVLDEHVYLSKEAHHVRPAGLCLGGGGLYAVVGARMWLEAGQAVNLIIRGHDWAEEHTYQLDRYGVAQYIDDPSEKTVKSRFTYTSATEWDWKLLTPAARCFPVHLPKAGLEELRWLHNLNFPINYLRTLKELDELKLTPRLCWEAHPDSARPESLGMIKSILPRVDIFSPNDKEAFRMLSIPADSQLCRESLIENCCHKFMDYGAKDIVVVRSGPLGACLLRKGWESCRWVPAYYTREASKVIDDTGAGNAFLGGLIAGLILAEDDLEEAALYATVSASYTIEQFGLPILNNDDDTWNQSRPHERLQEFKRFLAQKPPPAIVHSIGS